MMLCEYMSTDDFRTLHVFASVMKKLSLDALRILMRVWQWSADRKSVV